MRRLLVVDAWGGRVVEAKLMGVQVQEEQVRPGGSRTAVDRLETARCGRSRPKSAEAVKVVTGTRLSFGSAVTQSTLRLALSQS